MFRPLRWLVIATAFALPTAAAAQLQVNQNFVSQGPAPRFGPAGLVQSGDAIPNGSEGGAVSALVADPGNANRFFLGTPNGGIWRTTDGGVTWTPLTDKQASLSIASLALDPTDPNRNTLIAGTGLVSNGSTCFGTCFYTGSGGLQNGLLYSQDGGNTWKSIGAATLGGQTVDAVAARGNTIVAGTFEISGLTSPASLRRNGGLYRSTDGGATFTLISGAVGSGLPTGPVTSITGDPNNTNRLFAAVSSPNAATNAQTALFVSNDAGATWMQLFGAAQSGGTISAASQTVLKVASAPGGALAVGVVSLASNTVTGLFWSGNSGTSWTPLTVPNLNPGAQAPINFAIAIDPNNKNLVYVSGDRITASPFTVSAFRIDAVNSPGTATSITDANTGNGSTAHSDARTLTFDASGRLVLTSDGGIYARTNPASSTGVWTGLNGNLSAFEPYSVAYDAIGKRLTVAAQDNGSSIQSARNSLVWSPSNGGDGINTFVNDVTLKGAGLTAFYQNFQNLGAPTRVVLDAQGNQISPDFFSSARGSAISCNGGFVCSAVVVGVSFSSPWINNRVDPTRMALAGSHVYVTQDTLTGAQGPTVPIVDLTLTDLGNAVGAVLAIAYGTRDNPNMLVAGGFGGLFQSTTALAGSLIPVPAYAAAGGDVPTRNGLVLDPRSQLRYFAADGNNLFGTTNQGVTFANLTANLPAGMIRPNAVEFISNNGVNALLVGGLNNVANAQSPVAVADSDASGNLTNWRPFGTGLPNAQVNALAYNAAVDVLALSAFGRGVFTLYDVTSYFPQATVLQFGLADNDSVPDASFLTNGTVGNRPLIKYGTGTLTIAGDATYTGGTTINGGSVVLGTGGTSGSILGNVAFCSNPADPSCDPSTNKALAFNRSDTYTFGGSITGAGQVFQIGSGTTVLTGTNTYTGATTINAGTLEVDGSILNSSSVNVNFGGTLSGTGTVGSPTITIGLGGTLAPGNAANPTGTLTIIGNLAFQSGALYLVQVNATAASSTQVTGTASLAGTVLALFAPGNVLRSYDILHAAGGLGGTTFSGLTTNAPMNFAASLSYTSTDVFLNLTANLVGPSSNQQNVAAAINNFFNSGGTLPPGFLALFNLSDGNLANALSQLSGEAATGAQKVAFQLTDQFLNLMLDPFVDGRSGVGGADHPALGFAPERETMPPDIAHAYASMFKEPRAPLPPAYEPRWTIWGGAYGGSNRTTGDVAVIGSHDLSANTAGFAAGFDYRLTPDSVVGFALAGGGTNWSLAQGLGGGKSDAFQAGIYGATKYGPAYLAAAFAFANHWMSTDRLAVGDHLTADFNAQSYGGRLEGGYRFGMPYGVGITPYAAIQSQSFHTPSLTETDVIPNGFALAFASRDATDTRSELGARFDRVLAVYSNAVLALRGRVAWAHDWVSDPTLTSLFQALPGASFVVNGAVLPQNSALASAGGELRLANGVTLLAKFDGEFASHSSTYAGTGILRYRW
jgi:autotransporter-associated beta strand protein